MRIGIAGPVTLSMLESLFPSGTAIPTTYSFPLIVTLAERLHHGGRYVAGAEWPHHAIKAL
jgi:hypothetical protein